MFTLNKKTYMIFKKKIEENNDWKTIKIQKTCVAVEQPSYKQWFSEYVKPIRQYTVKHPQYNFK
jgi:hypothetical protein